MQNVDTSVQASAEDAVEDSDLRINLNDAAALTQLFEKHRSRVKPREDEDIHETILNSISRETGIAVIDLAFAYRNLLIEEMGERDAWMLFRMVEGINEQKLAAFIDDYNAILERTPDKKTAEIVFAIGFAKEDKYWRDSQEPTRIFKFASRYNLITIKQEA